MKDINKIIDEIDGYSSVLIYTIKKIKSWGRLNEDMLNDPDKVEVVDSMIFRFTKMQDAIGQKLFLAILDHIGEEYRNVPFIDILNRLEQLEFMDASLWKKFREARNILTHTYPWETEVIIDGITKTIDLSEELIAVYERLKKKLEKYM